jgi:hypothetical protein
LPIAEDLSTNEPRSRNPVRSRADRFASALSDANWIAVLVAFIPVCLLVLNISASTP